MAVLAHDCIHWLDARRSLAWLGLSLETIQIHDLSAIAIGRCSLRALAADATPGLTRYDNQHKGNSSLVIERPKFNEITQNS